MAFEGLRSKLRSLADSGSETSKQAAADARREAPERVKQARAATGGTVKSVAPATGLENNRQPRQPTTREKIAARLQSAGEMRKPIEDATLKPSADPRWMEEFARGDTNSGEWFGGGEQISDANEQYFAGSEETVGTRGGFARELLDERDHEGGHYAYEDDNEEGWLDDGVPMGDIMAESPDDSDMRWF